MKYLKPYHIFEMSGPGNLPQFIFKGVNYGNNNKSPRDHFGNKNGSPKKVTSFDHPEVILGEDGFYTQDDVKELIRKYKIWCQQHNEDPIPLDKMDPPTVNYINNLLQSES